MILRLPFIPLVVVGIASVAISVVAHFHVHRNMSASLPIFGPYLVWDPTPTTPMRVGDLIEACPPYDAAVEARQRGYEERGSCPGGVVPVLKLIAAVSGDYVTTSPGGVVVNGHTLPDSAEILHDAKGRLVLRRAYGTQQLLPGQLWLYGTAARSFDSRKFGPVSRSAVRFMAWAPIVYAPFPDLKHDAH